MTHGLYEVFIRDYAIELRVGLTPQERLAPQRLLISLTARGRAPLTPCALTACIDYALAVRVIEGWRNAPHTDLLETVATQLIHTLFTASPLIDALDLTLIKPDYYPNARGVGIRRALTREEWQQSASISPELHQN
ncbi:MAG: dihydroneopterin aldolase [Hydrogenophilus sp.]|nr:dihydroneopterin aldolase [Hydrogenophilus sp.]